MKPRRRSPLQVGTILSKALAVVGVTEERVTSIFGTCGCKRRIMKLNELSDWAYSLLTRQSKGEENIIEKGKEELENIITGKK